MKEHQTQFSLQKMSHIYGVSRSGYCAWLNRRPSQRELDNQNLIKHIQQAHKRSHGIYGSPRITELLHRKGINASENRIAGLMQRESIVGRIHSRKNRAPSIVEVIKKTHNKRLTAPLPTRINQLWVGDVTYL